MIVTVLQHQGVVEGWDGRAGATVSVTVVPATTTVVHAASGGSSTTERAASTAVYRQDKRSRGCHFVGRDGGVLVDRVIGVDREVEKPVDRSGARSESHRHRHHLRGLDCLAARLVEAPAFSPGRDILGALELEDVTRRNDVGAAREFDRHIEIEVISCVEGLRWQRRNVLDAHDKVADRNPEILLEIVAMSFEGPDVLVVQIEDFGVVLADPGPDTVSVYGLVPERSSTVSIATLAMAATSRMCGTSVRSPLSPSGAVTSFATIHAAARFRYRLTVSSSVSNRRHVLPAFPVRR